MKIKLDDKVYTVLKWIALILLPALATFFNVMAVAWNWDVPIEAVDTTFVAVETLIGALIGISTATYNAEKENK